jgi:sortase A
MVNRALGLLLIFIGAIALSWVGLHYLSAEWFDREAREALESLRHAPAGPTTPKPESMTVGEPIGTLEITRVGLSGVVVEGDSDAVLDRAIGHLPDTPLPWQHGNSALAAHRDTIFRPLKGVRLGDVLRLKTPHGDYDYRVTETLIVKPTEVWVLDPTPVTTLTLISCWPFNYIGNAPERFIVRAERIPTVRAQPESRVSANLN